MTHHSDTLIAEKHLGLNGLRRKRALLTTSAGTLCQAQAMQITHCTRVHEQKAQARAPIRHKGALPASRCPDLRERNRAVDPSTGPAVA